MKKSRSLNESNPADDLCKVGMNTAAVHAGTTTNGLTGASAPDIVMSTTFVIDPSVAFSADQINDETPTCTRAGATPPSDNSNANWQCLRAPRNVWPSGAEWQPSRLYSSLL